MKFLVRTLMALVFLLSCTQGIFLILFAHFENIEPEYTDAKEQIIVQNEPDSFFSKWMPNDNKSTKFLSKLGLVPATSNKKKIVAVMIENHEDARTHQVGLDKALMIQEWMVEGLISRFVVLISLDDLPEKIGPIRSLRPYFVDGTQPWTEVYFHAGGSPEGISKVYDNEKLTGINGLVSAYYKLFDRDNTIAAPHNFFLSKQSIDIITAGIDITKKVWPPYKVGRPEKNAPEVHEIDIDYFNPRHNIHYTYNPSSQEYVRTNGSVLRHGTPNNVLLLEIPINSFGEFGRLDMTVEGTGALVLFRSGRVYEGQWHKESVDTEFTFTGSGNTPLVFARGQTWMTVLPTLDRAKWTTIQPQTTE